MRIYLIGFMGSGKSSLGKELAHKLGLAFIDLDEQIEKKTGKEISDIFKSEGEEKFREIEHKCLKETFLTDNAVISTGGGTPCFYDNMKLINEKGIAVYIKLNSGILASRLGNDPGKRPLLIQFENKNDFQEHIDSLLQKREKYYMQAKVIVEEKNITSKLIIEKLSGSI